MSGDVLALLAPCALTVIAGILALMGERGVAALFATLGFALWLTGFLMNRTCPPASEPITAAQRPSYTICLFIEPRSFRCDTLS